MSRETERQAIMDEFETAWNPSWGKVAYPNHEFTTPINEKFAVVNIVERGTQRMSLGRVYLKRSHGSLQVDIYVPQALGTKPSREISDALESYFDSLDIVTSDNEPITFGTPRSRTMATNEQRAANLEDNWDRFIVECPYYRDQMVSK